LFSEGTSDAAVARRILNDRIDILIDGGGQTYQNNLGVLAYRPAPLQGTHLGFPGCLTGPAIQFVFADRHVLQEEELQHFASEGGKVVWLSSYQCNSMELVHRDVLDGSGDAQETASRWALADDNVLLIYVGPLGRLINKEGSVAAYASIMQRCPKAVLALRAEPWAAVGNVRDLLVQAGVEPARIKFYASRSKTRFLAMLRAWASRAIAFDTAPYGMHTHAADLNAVGMILICMLFAGAAWAGRVSAAVTSETVGTRETVAESMEQFIEIVVDLVEHPNKAQDIRRRLQAAREQKRGVFATERLAECYIHGIAEAVHRHRQGLPLQDIDTLSLAPPEIPRRVGPTLIDLEYRVCVLAGQHSSDAGAREGLEKVAKELIHLQVEREHGLEKAELLRCSILAVQLPQVLECTVRGSSSTRTKSISLPLLAVVPDRQKGKSLLFGQSWRHDRPVTIYDGNRKRRKDITDATHVISMSYNHDQLIDAAGIDLDVLASRCCLGALANHSNGKNTAHYKRCPDYYGPYSSELGVAVLYSLVDSSAGIEVTMSYTASAQRDHGIPSRRDDVMPGENRISADQCRRIPPDAQVVLDTLVGNGYSFDNLKGTGTFGIVAASVSRHGRPVAWKVSKIRSELTVPGQYVSLRNPIQREAFLLGMLEKAPMQIAPRLEREAPWGAAVMISVCRDDVYRSAFCMELFDVTLVECVHSLRNPVGELPIGTAISIGQAVLKCLRSVHEMGIIHGDIKGSNMLVKALHRTHNGTPVGTSVVSFVHGEDCFQLVLGDFGSGGWGTLKGGADDVDVRFGDWVAGVIALSGWRDVKAAFSPSRGFLPGRGTMFYRAPELEGRSECVVRWRETDVWSAGVTLYSLCFEEEKDSGRDKDRRNLLHTASLQAEFRRQGPPGSAGNATQPSKRARTAASKAVGAQRDRVQNDSSELWMLEFALTDKGLTARARNQIASMRADPRTCQMFSLLGALLRHDPSTRVSADGALSLIREPGSVFESANERRLPRPPISDFEKDGTRFMEPRAITSEEIAEIELDFGARGLGPLDIASKFSELVASKNFAYLRSLNGISDIKLLRQGFDLLEQSLRDSAPDIPADWEEVFLEIPGPDGKLRVGDRSKWLKPLPDDHPAVRWMDSVVGKLRPGSHPRKPVAINQVPSKVYRVQPMHLDLAANTRKGRINANNVRIYEEQSSREPMCLWVPRSRTRMVLMIGANKLVLALYQQAEVVYNQEFEAWRRQGPGVKTEAQFAAVWVRRMVDHLHSRFPAHREVEPVMLTVDGPYEGLAFSGLSLHGGSTDAGLRVFCTFASEEVFKFCSAVHGGTSQIAFEHAALSLNARFSSMPCRSFTEFSRRASSTRTTPPAWRRKACTSRRCFTGM
jgi:serine/threonine protein kinase